MERIKLNITNPGNYGGEEAGAIPPCWASEYIVWDNSEQCDYHVWVDDWVDNWSSLHHSKAKYKIAVLMEPKQMISVSYKMVEGMLDKFDLVFTHYPEDLLISDKYRYYAGGCRSFIYPEQRAVYEKTKNICSIMSSKAYMPGHHMRHSIRNLLSQSGKLGEVDYNTPPMDRKVEGLRDYRFELVIENEDNPFFSEKIIDSMLCGCIPIYWSNSSLEHLETFDKDGIILFRDENDFFEKLDSNYFTEELYNSKIEAVKYNFENSKKFASFGDVLWNSGLKEFIEKTI